MEFIALLSLGHCIFTLTSHSRPGLPLEEATPPAPRRGREMRPRTYRSRVHAQRPLEGEPVNVFARKRGLFKKDSYRFLVVVVAVYTHDAGWHCILHTAPFLVIAITGWRMEGDW